MGARRYLEKALGSWEVDAFADLANVDRSHGVEAYIVADGVWVRWNAYTDKWYVVPVGVEALDGMLSI